MRALFVLGRALFGGFFVWSGVHHFIDHHKLSRYAALNGVPGPDAAVQATGGMLIASGASVLSGVGPRMGLAAIVAFLVPVSLQMHRFWEVQDPAHRQQEMINFAKNMALAGAALMVMAVEEPWPASVTELRADGEELYIHLGNRDLRALRVLS